MAYLTAGNISLFVLLLDRSFLLMHDHLCKNLLQETEEEHIGRFLSDNLTKLTQQTEYSGRPPSSRIHKILRLFFRLAEQGDLLIAGSLLLVILA